MTLLTWGPELELGIPEIDRQHQRLVGILNALDSGVKHGYCRNILGSVLQELVKYTVFHFTFEERLMKTYHLPSADGHAAEHAAFTTTVLEFQSRFDVGHKDVSDDVLRFLRDWLKGHIMGTDHAMVTLLRSKIDHEVLTAMACAVGEPSLTH
ncbi:MAG: bacteriohemerythrin [Austwickia sp.]|nr:bacteriohemerythrin [Austwickia sp.]MBK8437235.1 bacteriohemerythrin [Austwickia sp.]MBK9102469.1 bacteriohemerythrin [Austwickia sp.]